MYRMMHSHGTGRLARRMIPPEGDVIALKNAGEAFDVPPGMRQIHGAGIAQLEIMAFANVAGRAEADDRHPGGNGRPDPARAVFNHETLVRTRAQSACGEQKNFQASFLARPYPR